MRDSKYHCTLLKYSIKEYFLVDVDGPSRKQKDVYYRMAYVGYLRETYGVTYQQLARFCNRNHSSCIYFTKQSKYLLQSPYYEFQEIYNNIRKLDAIINKNIVEKRRQGKVRKKFSIKKPTPKIPSVI